MVRDLTVATATLLGTVVALQRLVGTSNPTTAALALLLIVLATATLSRLTVAIAISVASMFAFNYFFLPPLHTLTIADPHNWVALVAFLVVAIIASNLSAAAHSRAREATDRRNEVTRLFDLSRDVLLTTETPGALDALARHIARRFELSRLAVCVPGSDGWEVHEGGDQPVHLDTNQLDMTFATARGALEFDARRRTYGGHVTTTTEQGEVVSLVPLRLGTKPVGLLAASAGALEPGTMDALGGLAAIAIERVQFLRERDAAERTRQQADLASALLAALSHDLRTPLTAIKVAVENLRDPDMPADQRRKQAQHALIELDRLTGLFEDILDMARIDVAAITAVREWVTPADIIDAAAAHARHALHGRSLTVDADGDIESYVDPGLTSTALSHLLENAAKYSPSGTPILVSAHAEDEELRITVTDRGPGLDPGELDHLFERFYRGRSARESTPGSGMGLAISRGLLAAEKGRVGAENAAEGGARFTIVVPCRVREAAKV
jgi:two-component system sensor histidine kinase KdpD